MYSRQLLLLNFEIYQCLSKYIDHAKLRLNSLVLQKEKAPQYHTVNKAYVRSKKAIYDIIHVTM